MKTKSIYGNCLFGAVYLYLRGKVKKVHLISSPARMVPAHIVVETKKRHCIHFKFSTPQNPIYFNGYFEGIRKSETKSYLKKHRREMLCSMNPHTYFLLAWLIILVLTIPWICFWPLAVIWRFLNDIFTLGKRRFNRLVDYYFCNNSSR